MKNLWRALALFMLPGAVLGGGTLTAFFRLADSAFEPLIVCCFGALLWCVAVLSSILFLNRFAQFARKYYHLCAVTALLFTLGLGVVRLVGFSGWIEGVAGTVFAGWVSAGFIHCFAGEYFKIKDRWLFVLGIFAAGAMAWFLNDSMRIAWLETFFFYCSEALLLVLMLASPLTLFGKWYRRWSWRLGLFAIAAVVVMVSPPFGFKPWNDTPECLPGGLWQRTFITPQGSRFLWVDAQDNRGLFTANGQLICWKSADNELYSAMPGLLGVLKNSRPQIKMLVPEGSLLPGAVRNIPGNNVTVQYTPESLKPSLGLGTALLFDKLLKKDLYNSGRYDLLLITVLPDNQYAGSIEKFLADNCGELKSDGVLAIPENLLHNQTLFRLLNEGFEFCGVLPAPGSLWVFSHRKLEMAPEAIDRNLQRLYGEKSPVLPGTYTALFSQTSSWQEFLPSPEVADIQWGYNRWFGNWFWLLPGVGVILLWQLIRLFGGRRIGLNKYCNSLENGFAAMSCHLLCLELLLVKGGLFNLSIAVLALLGALFILRVKYCSIYLLLPAILLLPLMAESNMYLWAIALVMIINMLYTGSLQNYAGLELKEERSLWNAFTLGLFAGALLVTAIWAWQMPLSVMVLWILSARLPGIWQNKYMRVYYEKKQEGVSA